MCSRIYKDNWLPTRTLRADASIRPYNATVTIHHFTLDNPSIPVYNKYNSKMYKGVTVL